MQNGEIGIATGAGFAAVGSLKILDRIPVQYYIVRMSSITYTEAREHLASVWDHAVATREPVVISRRGTESVVLLPLDEWEGIQETAHLLRSPSNARRLLAALVRLDNGGGVSLDADQLRTQVGMA
jgi:antitoxin YefM